MEASLFEWPGILLEHIEPQTVEAAVAQEPKDSHL
jgi:hypothetical protein